MKLLDSESKQVCRAMVWLGGLENEAESAAEPPETPANEGKNEKMKNVASDSVPWATLLKAVAVRETTTEKRLPVGLVNNFTTYFLHHRTCPDISKSPGSAIMNKFGSGQPQPQKKHRKHVAE